MLLTGSGGRRSSRAGTSGDGPAGDRAAGTATIIRGRFRRGEESAFDRRDGGWYGGGVRSQAGCARPGDRQRRSGQEGFDAMCTTVPSLGRSHPQRGIPPAAIAPPRLVAAVPLLAAALIAAALAVPPRPAFGQGPPRGQLQQLDRETGVGTVDAVAPGMMRLKLKGDELWTVVPAPTAKVEVVGTAAREMLQAGTFVVCAVQLDEQGKVTDPPARITFPGTGTPGVTAGGLGIAEPGAKRQAGKRPAGIYLVAGTIKAATDDVVTVQAGREKIDVPVTPETELLVNTQDCSIVEPGDKVTVEGQYYRRGELQATVLTITRTNPLMPPPKKGPRRPAKTAP